ncbi:hypothetical protein F4Y93_06095 [Candidatus Poribacteria bacterium]|nr:hypothetical protein [Candidatus Poribacteria bacterium]
MIKKYLPLILILVLCVALYLPLYLKVSDLSAPVIRPVPLPEITKPLPVAEPSPHADDIAQISTAVGLDLSRLIQLITRDEGKRRTPYLDKKGKVTIGIGRSLTTNGISVAELLAILPNPDYPLILQETEVKNGRIYISSLEVAEGLFDRPLTEHDIALLLADDLKNTHREAKSVFGETWQEINAARQEAIVDVLFNTGLPHFRTFVKFIEAVKNRNWETAGNELLLSEAARKDPGRYFRNAAVIRTGNRKHFDLQ